VAVDAATRHRPRREPRLLEPHRPVRRLPMVEA
jgi:hypothetical protein